MNAELIARLEAAEVGSRELDIKLAMETEYPYGFDEPEDEGNCPSYTTSLDAALALAVRVLPPHGQIIIAWGISADIQIDSNDPCSPPLASAFHMSAPVALCIAILRALDAKQEVA